MDRDRRKALWWHRVAIGLAVVVLVNELIGWVWSEGHNRPRFFETHSLR